MPSISSSTRPDTNKHIIMPQNQSQGYQSISKTHNLTVCGAKYSINRSDATLYSDFMGISAVLRLIEGPESNGTSLSCFPLKEHFAFLAANNPPITDIKWRDEEPMFVYTRDEFEKEPSGVWFEYISPQQGRLYNQVVGWIETKLIEAKPGGVVNILFQQRQPNQTGDYTWEQSA